MCGICGKVNFARNGTRVDEYLPEMMASIITETQGKPWEYYRNMTRQLWDEARHAMMGEAGFTDLGID